MFLTDATRAVGGKICGNIYNEGAMAIEKVRRSQLARKLVILNNLVSFFLWFCCWFRLQILALLVGRRFVPGGIAEYFQYLQTYSLISQMILAFTAVKVSKNKRYLKVLKAFNGLLITWAVIYQYPKVSRHTAYMIYVLAVSLSETLGFLYYLFPLQLLKTLKKYNFLVLFPTQKIAEAILILVSFKFVDNNNDFQYFVSLFLKALLLFYVPSTYIVYRYLWKTRTA